MIEGNDDGPDDRSVDTEFSHMFSAAFHAIRNSEGLSEEEQWKRIKPVVDYLEEARNLNVSECLYLADLFWRQIRSSARGRPEISGREERRRFLIIASCYSLMRDATISGRKLSKEDAAQIISQQNARATKEQIITWIRNLSATDRKFLSNISMEKARLFYSG